MTYLSLVAAALLLLGSALVIHALIEADAADAEPSLPHDKPAAAKPSPRPPLEATHRRAA